MWVVVEKVTGVEICMVIVELVVLAARVIRGEEADVATKAMAEATMRMMEDMIMEEMREWMMEGIVLEVVREAVDERTMEYELTRLRSGSPGLQRDQRWTCQLMWVGRWRRQW